MRVPRRQVTFAREADGHASITRIWYVFEQERPHRFFTMLYIG
jgi:hypothetical protein